MTDDIKELLKTIRGGNVSKKLKVEIYAEIRKCVRLDEALEEQDLYTIIEDLDDSDEEIRETAWSILNLCKVTVGSEIFNRFIKLVNDKNVILQQFQCCTTAKENLIYALKDYIKAPNFSLEELLSNYYNETEAITTLFIEMCKRLSKTETADFICYKLFPLIFHTENEKLRDAALEIGMGITSFNTLADLDPEKYKDFLAAIENEYILSIRNVLGKMKHPNWHKMFILLLRYGGIMFHQRVDITNAILKIAESGFKSSSIDNKLFAFDCWKELINNYSLNLTHMTMPKHIKLLVTPLKANLSSNEAVINKRFEIWIYLLKKLGDKAVVCLEHFLNFCFGPLGASPLVATNNPAIASPGKKVVRLYKKSPKFLLEMLGHYGHNSNDPCVYYEEELKLKKPILNNSNFQTIYTPVIHSIGECCIILSKWNSDAAELSRVIHCMWGSLLNFINELNSDIKEKVLQVVSNQVLALSKVADNDSDYLDRILMPIINTIMSFECTDTNDSLFKPVLVPSLKYLNATGKFNTTRLRQSMDAAFSSKRNFIKVRMFGDFCDLITEIEKVKLSYPLWITLSHFVPDLCRTCPINEVFSGHLLSYMLWPVNNYNYIPEDEKQNIISTWKRLMEDICKSNALVHKNHHNFLTSIIHSFQKIIKKKPLVINSVSFFLPLLSLDSLKDDDLDPLFISDLLQLVLDLLDCPLTSKENINKLALILTVCINNVLRHPNGKADLIYEKLFKAIEYFLQPHQVYSVLDKLENILSKNCISRERVPLALKSLISDLTLHKDSEISRNAIKILSLLENSTNEDTLKSSSENFIENSNSLLSRSSTKNIVQKSTKPTFIENTRVIQQLLEKNTTPMKLKGSQLKNSPKSSTASTTTPFRSSTTKKLPSRADKKETYVLIENNYKFDKRKLTEHQKEKMKKRREDIPALYQDLSQSQTGSTSNSQSNSQEDAIGKDLKVIVERMPYIECNDFTDDSNRNCSSANHEVNKCKENTSYDDMQQINLVINETNKTEQKIKENAKPAITSTEDIFIGTSLEKETNKPAESLAAEKSGEENVESVKRNKRITNELLRLKMDIVGGDINIDVNEERKSRRNSKQLDKTTSPFIFQFDKRESAETPKSKKKKIQKTSKNVGKTKRHYVETNTVNSNNSSGKEPPKRKCRKKRSQSLTHDNDKALVIKNNLNRRSRSNSETKEYISCSNSSSDIHSSLRNENSDYCSEDIIESSQESYISFGKSLCKTSPNPNQITKNTFTSAVDSVVDGDVESPYTDSICTISCNNQQTGTDKRIQQFQFKEKSLESQTVQIVECGANEKLKEIEEQKSDTIVISEDFSPDKLIRKDLDQIERKLTKREIEIAEADTESLPVDNLDDFKTCSETPEASYEHAIETQNEEIVSCTKEDDVMEPEKDEKTPSLFDSEADDQKGCAANLQQHLEEDAKLVDNENKSKMVSQQQPSSRSARLVGLVTTTNLVNEKSPHMNSSLKRKSDAVSFKTASTVFSPKTSRVRKMMQNCEDQRPLFIIDLDDEVKEKIPDNQLLQFSREIPSPLATPKGSILKRKRDVNGYLSDDNLQSAKRKRVNFSDPPTTCKKVFIQHQDELVNRHRGIKKNLLLTTKLPTKEVDIIISSENDHNSVRATEEEGCKSTSHELPSESSSKEIVDTEMTQECDKVIINDYTVEGNMNIQFSEDISFLDDVVPICPDLTDCLENVEVISNKLNTPLCKSALLEELNKKNIHTIADLALLTEKKINSLTLDQPKMAEVKRALFEFKEAKKSELINEIINDNIEHVLDSDKIEESISSGNITLLEETDLNTTTVLINGEPNVLSTPSSSSLASEDTNQNQPHCLESKDQYDEIERLINGTTEENLEQFVVLAIKKLSESHNSQNVLKRLIGTIIEKMPRSVTWKTFHEYLTKLFITEDCD